MAPIRINLLLDPELDQDLFQHFSKIGSRRRAGEVRNLAVEGLRLKLSGANLSHPTPVINEGDPVPTNAVKDEKPLAKKKVKKEKKMPR